MTNVTANAETLKDLPFSDLLLGDGEAFVKSHGEGGQFPPPLALLPTSLKDEATQLRVSLEEEARDEFALLHDGIRYRVSRMQTVQGVWYALRRSPTTIPSLSDLGIAKVLQERLCSQDLTHGLVLFSGAMASGKTSSASAMVAERLHRHGGYAVTLESPPEHPLQGLHGTGVCLQNEVPYGDMGESIVKVLRYAAPNIIFLGELRSPFEVTQALRAAINGHLVISTFHSKGVLETLQRFVALGAEHEPMAHELLADGLSAVIHQTLDDRLRLQFLFVDDTRTGGAVRAKLRNKEINNLGTEIQAQKNELLFERG